MAPQPAGAGDRLEAEIDRLYIEGSQELDRSKRVEIYHRAQKIAAENVPVIYTTLPERLTAVRNCLRQHDTHAVRDMGRPLRIQD